MPRPLIALIIVRYRRIMMRRRCFVRVHRAVALPAAEALPELLGDVRRDRRQHADIDVLHLVPDRRRGRALGPRVHQLVEQLHHLPVAFLLVVHLGQ